MATSRALALCAVWGMMVVASSARPKEDGMYTTRWDNINLDEILHSERLLKNYVKCLLDQGPCTADGAELKRILPDALETECSKCSEGQKRSADKVVQFLIDEKPREWEQLEKKYDEGGVYRLHYKALKAGKPEEGEEGEEEPTATDAV